MLSFQAMETCSLLLVSDDPLARAGLAYLLAEQLHYTIIDQINSQTWFDDPDFAGDPLPDAIVWDVGWELPPALPEILPLGPPILTLTSDAELASEIWAWGARTILQRDVEPERLEAALQATLQNLTVLDPAFVTQISSILTGDETGLQSDLTPRELEVLKLLAEGKTNKAIAQEIGVSSHTVKFHVTSLLGKLNAQSRTEAVVQATRLGLIAL